MWWDHQSDFKISNGKSFNSNNLTSTGCVFTLAWDCKIPITVYLLQPNFMLRTEINYIKSEGKLVFSFPLEFVLSNNVIEYIFQSKVLTILSGCSREFFSEMRFCCEFHKQTAKLLCRTVLTTAPLQINARQPLCGEVMFLVVSVCPQIVLNNILLNS